MKIIILTHHDKRLSIDSLWTTKKDNLGPKKTFGIKVPWVEFYLLPQNYTYSMYTNNNYRLKDSVG